ncbi:MAG TPA: hypothetical protein VEU96_23260 [Bryobacteraceae bacterium]|nr:hypothetical protein [Bryobacteraceae bacterium]
MPDQENKQEKGKYVGAQVVMVVLVTLIAIGIGVWGPDSAKTRLTMSIGYGLLVLVFLFGMVVLVEIIRGNIDLATLLNEGGKASMSRFQLLIFTFVIGLSLFLMVAARPDAEKFPDIPANVLALLGISASTYAVSKGIQAGSKNDDAEKK